MVTICMRFDHPIPICAGAPQPQSVAELLIYDEVVSPAERKLWGAGVDAESFAEKLRATSGDLTIRINSPGGDVDNGLAIYNLLQGERAAGRRITCIVDGGAHSIASVIAMAGDEVHMAEASRMLVHHPRMFAMGTADDMRQALQRLEAGGEAIRTAYRQKTGQEDAALNALMSAETFLTPESAKRLKFADKVLEVPARAPMQASADFHHPLARAVALLAAQTPQPAAAKDDNMSKPTEQGAVELVEQAKLDAAQSEVASLKAQAQAAAPVLAAVKTLTGKSDPIEQIVELASLQGRLAALPSAEQQRATERANLVTELQRKQVPPTTIQALEAACDAAGGDLAVLRAGAAKLEAPKPYAPATQERNAAAPQTSGEPVLTKGIKAQYERCGITDEAQMLAAEKSRLAGGTHQSESDDEDKE